MFILNKNNLRRQQGFSVIEVIIALGISTIIVSGIIGLLVQSMKYTRWSEHRWQATSYAAGAIDAVVNIKENDWQTVAAYATDGTVYRLTTSGGQWQLVPDAGGETLGIYTRVITFSQICRDGANAIAPCGGGNLPDPDSRKITVTMNWTESEGNSRSLQLEQYLMNWPVCYARWPYIYGSRYSYDTDKIEVTGGQAGLIDRTAEVIPNGNFATGDFTAWDTSGNAWVVVSDGGNFIASTEANPTRVGVISNQNSFTAAGQQLRFRHRGWGGSQVFPVGFFTDETQSDFDSGTYVDTQFNSSLVLTAQGMNHGTGNYTSAIKNAGQVRPWPKLAWLTQWPIGKELPNDGQSETGYPAGNANMNSNVLLMHMNESGGPIIDNSGNGNNGTNNGATYGAVGVLNTAMSFPGNTNISVPAAGSLDLTTEGSLVTWLRVDNFRDFAGLLHKGQQSNFSDDAYFLQFGGPASGLGNNRRLIGGGHDGVANRFIVSNAELDPDVWYHAVYTWDSSGQKLYIDGALDIESSVVLNARTSPGSLQIGSQLPNNYYFDGEIDEMSLYGRALSATEVKDLYQRGALDLKIQVRSCADSSCSGESFVGPDGTAATFYSELNNNEPSYPILSLNSITDNQYFQYQVTLTTANTSLTPRLLKITAGDFGSFSGSNYMAVVRAINHEELIRVEPPADNNWQDVILDLSPYPNESIYLNIIDNSTDPLEGWYAVDDFRQTDSDGNAIEGYATNRPDITPNDSHSIYDLAGWYSFAADNSGTGTVYFQLSNDNGSTWYYWNGSSWAVAGSNDYSLEVDVVNNIPSFPSGTHLSVRAFLASDGSQPVFLDEIVVAYEGTCTAANVLLEENFEGGTLTGWEPSPNWGNLSLWEIATLGSTQTAHNFSGGHNIIYKSGTTGWTDYTYTAKVRRSNTSPMGIVFRFNDGTNFWRYLRESGYMLVRGQVGGWVNAGNHGNNWFAVDDTVPDQWYWFKVQVQGDIIRVKHWADGVTEPAAWEREIEDDRLMQGGVGMMGWGGTYFDDLLVEAL